MNKTTKNYLNNKKKMLHIVEAFAGGILTYLVDLTNHLCDEYDIYIAYAIRPQTPENYKNYFNKKIKLIEIKNFTRSINPSKDTKALLEIKRIVKEINPDIIHLHSTKAGVLGRLAINNKNISMFYTPHGYSFLMQNDSNTKRSIYKFIEEICGKKYCTTIACSKGEYDESLNITKFSTYINNGINIDELDKLIKHYNTNETNHTTTVFTLGRISYQKNPELFNSVAEKLPNVKFLWIGDGDLRDKLTSSNIEITEWVNREKALEYSMQGDIFILPSLWEGLPMSLLEAMYMKKLCLVSNVIGNRDVIKNGINGFICESAEEFANVINNQINNINHTIINNAYQDILDEYNTKIMVKKYDDIYSKELII